MKNVEFKYFDGVILEDNEIESESDILENSDTLNDPIISPEEK